MLHRYRALLATRRRHLPATRVPVEWLESGSGSGPVLAYRRGDLLVAANCGEEPTVIQPPGRWATAFTTVFTTVFTTALQDPADAVMHPSQEPTGLELHPNPGRHAPTQPAVMTVHPTGRQAAPALASA
jgi:Domain of unknown function (DUF3459)